EAADEAGEGGRPLVEAGARAAERALRAGRLHARNADRAGGHLLAPVRAEAAPAGGPGETARDGFGRVGTEEGGAEARPLVRRRHRRRPPRPLRLTWSCAGRRFLSCHCYASSPAAAG